MYFFSSLNKQRQTGFTLIELLVALTIFAILSTMGWQLFDQITKTKERVSIQAEKVARLQYAYMQVARDINQYVNRVGFSVGFTNKAINDSIESFSIGFDVFENQLSFTKKSQFDPRYLGTSTDTKPLPFERVTYKLEDNKFMRYSSKRIDDSAAIPLPAVLLENVTNFRVVVLDPGVSYVWPPENDDASLNTTEEEPSDEEILAEATQIPLGFEISFEYEQMPINWRFALVKNLPEIEPPKIKNTDGENSDTDKNGNNTNNANNTNNSQSGSSNSQNNNSASSDDEIPDD